MKPDFEKIVDLAREGNADAVESLVNAVKDRIYALSIKMLYHIQDAEDASQEILIKIVTRLGGFKKESSFSTWAMKIASNHLLNKQKYRARQQLTFKSCEEMIIREMPDQSTAPHNEIESGILLNEMRILCVQGLLQCLNWDHRVVYILGQTMDVSSAEGALILEINPATFRKRLSRAREQIRNFLVKNCELFDDHNPCKCHIQSAEAVRRKLIDPENPRHTTHPSNREKTGFISHLQDIEKLSREAALMRIHPDYTAPESFVERIKNMMDSGRFKKLKTLNHTEVMSCQK